MREQLLQFLTTPSWQRSLLYILFYFTTAWVVHRFSWRIAGRLVRLTRFTSARRRPRPERQRTIRGLMASGISLFALVLAALFSLSLFIDVDTLIWMVGLFSAAFGLGARPLISDFLTGISFMLEDQLDVGDKVELLSIEGVVEAVNLRTLLLRSPTGELYVIPNGEVRVVRNFSRGRFSTANITIQLNAADLTNALPILEALSSEAVELLPNLLEPWQVISQTGTIGQHTELTLLTKARYGKAAEMRPRLLALVQDRLNEKGIELVG